jgi:CRP/FNR family cyclic AMP-dependent transcriptional regulator
MTKIETAMQLARGVLARTAWFQGLDDTDSAMFFQRGRIVEIADGAAVSRRGDQVHHFSCLIDGVLDVSLASKSGKRHLLVCLEPGQPVNVIGLIDGLPASHDVYSRGDSRLLTLTRAEFLEGMERSPRLYRVVVGLLCARARTFYDAYAANALLSLRSRVAQQLLSLASAYGLPREGSVHISLKLSQDTFADMLACTRQSANRELKRLEREGVIDMSYSQFTILDPATLAAVSSGEV